MVDWTNSKIIGMQCMQELFFRLCELRWDIVLVMSSLLLKKKSLDLKKNENNALVKLKDRKKISYLSEINSLVVISWSIVYVVWVIRNKNTYFTLRDRWREWGRERGGRERGREGGEREGGREGGEREGGREGEREWEKEREREKIYFY